MTRGSIYTPVAPEPQQSKLSAGWRSTRALLVLFAINILNFYDRNAPGALTEPIRKEFGLSDTQVGFLATAFTLLYAIVGVPLGKLADIGSRKRILAGGVLV